MKTYLAYALAAGIVAGIIGWQHTTVTRLEASGADKDRVIGEVTAANTVLSAALDGALERAHKNDALLAAHAGTIEAAAMRARRLERQLREALAHETTFDLDAPLPRAAADAFCLRWLSASGYLSGDHQGYAAGVVAPGTGDTAAGGGPAFCAGWDTVTYRDALEWAGLLLDHAGAERIDKAGVRGWVAGLPNGEGEACPR